MTSKPVVEQHVLFIDSRYADGASNVDFSVIFNKSVQTHTSGYPTQVFKNVSAVELTAFSIHSGCLGDTDETYLALDIEELNNRLHSNVPEVNQCFAIMYLDKESSPKEKSFKGQDFDIKVKKFDPPLSSLSRLTVKLKNASSRQNVLDLGKTTMILKINTIKSSA